MKRGSLRFVPIPIRAWVVVLTGFFLTIGPAAEPAGLKREVFPVPAVIAGIFQSGGLTAFDPFTVWERGSAVPPAALRRAKPGTDDGLLPQGVCYDVLPVWTARGFRPKEGTRVRYHPGSQRLFASIAAGDEAEIRAFCQWPPELWLEDNRWRGSRLHQLQVQVTVWAVPAVGPGGWQFKPELPDDLMALPAESRRMVGRQTIAVRGGQKAKAEAITRLRQTREETGPGMVTEVECSFADDGESLYFNFAVNWQTSAQPGGLSGTVVAFQTMAKFGRGWVVEAGCLPGNPPERLFFVFDSHPVEQGAADLLDRGKVVARWTGGPAEAPLAADGRAGQLFSIYQIQDLARSREAAALPEPAPDSDPFGPVEGGIDPLAGLDRENMPAGLVSELFGEAMMAEVTPELERFFGLESGDIQAWVLRHSLFSSDYVFMAGKPAALHSINRQMTKEQANYYNHWGITLTADATLALAGPGATADQEQVIWRGRVPVMGGQTSRLQHLAWPEIAEGSKPVPGGWDLQIEGRRPGRAAEARRNEPEKADPWELVVGGSLRPPLVETAVELPVLTETGTPDGASLRRTFGQTSDRRQIILKVALTVDADKSAKSDNVRFRHPARLGAGNMAWWWQQQVAGAGVR